MGEVAERTEHGAGVRGRVSQRLIQLDWEALQLLSVQPASRKLGQG